jgi:hypothetical protein
VIEIPKHLILLHYSSVRFLHSDNLLLHSKLADSLGPEQLSYAMFPSSSPGMRWQTSARLRIHQRRARHGRTANYKPDYSIPRVWRSALHQPCPHLPISVKSQPRHASAPLHCAFFHLPTPLFASSLSFYITRFFVFCHQLLLDDSLRCYCGK